MKNKIVLDQSFDQVDDNQENDSDGDSSDEEKDELDVMNEIRIGERRSTRKRQQPETLHRYMRLDPTLIKITPFDS